MGRGSGMTIKMGNSSGRRPNTDVGVKSDRLNETDNFDLAPITSSSNLKKGWGKVYRKISFKEKKGEEKRKR